MKTGWTRRALVSAVPALALVAAMPRRGRAWQGTAGRGEWAFVDDRNREVVLPRAPERIVAQINAAAALWDYGVRPLAVFGPQRMADGTPDPQAGRIDLDAVESVGDIWDGFDLERLIALRPDVLIAPMFVEDELWYVPPAAQAALEERLPSIGIRATNLPMIDLVTRFAELASALGADMTSGENLAASRAMDDSVAELREAIAANAGLAVMFVSGTPDALYVGNPEAVADLIHFGELGMTIANPDVDGFWEELSWEAVGTYQADLIMVDQRAGSMTPEEMQGIATWRALPAVAAGQVALWNPEPIYSYRGYTEVLRAMARIAREARADVV